jgi:hypothetical protein
MNISRAPAKDSHGKKWDKVSEKMTYVAKEKSEICHISNNSG